MYRQVGCITINTHTMKRILFILLTVVLVVAFSGCANDVDSGQIQEGLHEVVFHAGWDPETKTVLQEDLSIWWEPGDAISLFVNDQGNYYGYRLASTNEEPAPRVDFVGQIGGPYAGQSFFAIYPYTPEIWLDGYNNCFVVPFPSVQEAIEGTFNKNLLISVAVSDNDRLFFKNVCGGIQFSVANEGIEKITIETISDEGHIPNALGISPSFEIMYYGGPQVVEITPPNGGTFASGAYYYAILPAMEYHGLKISFIRGDEVATFKDNSDITIKKSVFKRLYNKDAELSFEKILKKALLPNPIFPEGIDKTTITDINFVVNSEKETEVIIGDNQDGYMPIYLEQNGTTINLYTKGDVYEISNSSMLFENMSSLQSLDLSNLIVGKNCTSMYAMFSGCQSLRSLSLGSFCAENVEYMHDMFRNCNQLTELDLSTIYNTNKVWAMGAMFLNCNSLTSLNLSSFNTENVTQMDLMFDGCSKLRELNLTNFNTSKVETMGALFENCFSLEHLDISSFSYNNCTNCYNMFTRCTNLMFLDCGTNELPRDYIGGMLEFAQSIPFCYIRCSESTKDNLLQPEVQLNATKVNWVDIDEELPQYYSYKDPNLYYSSDYSMDKKVVTIQKSKTGEGADLIIMGDAYSDRLIEDGTYDRDLGAAIDAVFSLEPMASYRDLFNVYKVYAVSETEVVGKNTALHTQTGSDGYMMASSYVCNSYAAIACPGKGIDGLGSTYNNASIIVVINSENDSGISWMSAQMTDEYLSDYGKSTEAMAFIGKGTDETVFQQTVVHEFGHIFAKLADEYYGNEELTESLANALKEDDLQGGWNKNVDYTSDPHMVKWSAFLYDDRYENECLGVFEGGRAHYSKGVWRPTDNSVMRDHMWKHGFNAPSREAIYHRIHKLAYGKDWQYDYETFVQQDLKNIPAEPYFQSSPRYVPYPMRVSKKHLFKMEESIAPDGRKMVTVIMD